MSTVRKPAEYYLPGDYPAAGLPPHALVCWDFERYIWQCVRLKTRPVRIVRIEK